MRKLIVLLFVSVPCWASGPRFGPAYDSEKTNLEFQNVYQDIRSPKISTGTAQNFTITNALFTNVNIYGTQTFSDGTTITSSSQTVVQRWFTKVSGTGQTTGTTYLPAGPNITTGTLKKAKDYLLIRFFMPAYASNGVCRVRLSCGGNVVGTTMGAYANDGVGPINGGEAAGVYTYYPNSISAVNCTLDYSAAVAGTVAGIGGDGSTGYDSTMEIEEISQ